MIVLFVDDEWSRVRGPRGDRWIRTDAIARHGLTGAYARWTRVVQVNGHWTTVAGGA